MPSANPRINVVMSPSLHATVSRLAGLRGESKSAIIREVLEMLQPTLDRTVDTLVKLDAQERFLKAQKAGTENDFRDRAGSILDDAQKEMAPFLEAMENMFSEFEKLPTDTPHCNTGYTSQPEDSSEAGQKPQKPCLVSHLPKSRHGG